MCPVVTPNFDESPTLQPGEYGARIIGCEVKTSKNNTPYLSFKFETLDTRQWVFTNTGLTGKGAHLLKSIIRASYLPDYESGQIDTDQLLGKTLGIKVDFGMNQDGTQSKYLQVYEVAPFEDPFDPFG